MNTPERSKLIAKALAAEPVDLPPDFAAQMAARADAGVADSRWSWSDGALIASFLVMLCICVVGWFVFAADESGGSDALPAVLNISALDPWAFIGAVAVGLIQLLDFSKRARALSR